MALLNRDFRFNIIAKIEVASACALFFGTIVSALLLRNYWALWFGTALAAITTGVGVWMSSSWRPSLTISFKETRTLVRFGGSLTGFSLMNFFGRNADNILLGRVWGASALGLYDRSYRLMMFPIQNVNVPLSRVMIPVLSRARENPDQYRRLYLLGLRAITMLTFPGLAVAAATSDTLVGLLLGPEWSEAAPIFFWLSLAAFFQPVGNTSGWLYVSHGRGREMLWMGGLSALVTIGAFLVGVQWGAVGVAAAYFISTGARMPFIIGWAARSTSVHWSDTYLLCLPSLIGAGGAWVLARVLSEQLPAIWLIGASLIISYALSLCCNALTPGGRDLIRAALNLILSKRLPPRM